MTDAIDNLDKGRTLGGQYAQEHRAAHPVVHAFNAFGRGEGDRRKTSAAFHRIEVAKACDACDLDMDNGEVREVDLGKVAVGRRKLVRGRLARASATMGGKPRAEGVEPITVTERADKPGHYVVVRDHGEHRVAALKINGHASPVPVRVVKAKQKPEDWIKAKTALLIREGKDPMQAVAIANAMAREMGKFDEHQPRDDSGKFASIEGGGLARYSIAGGLANGPGAPGTGFKIPPPPSATLSAAPKEKTPDEQRAAFRQKIGEAARAEFGTDKPSREQVQSRSQDQKAKYGKDAKVWVWDPVSGSAMPGTVARDAKSDAFDRSGQREDRQYVVNVPDIDKGGTRPVTAYHGDIAPRGLKKLGKVMATDAPGAGAEYAPPEGVTRRDAIRERRRKRWEVKLKKSEVHPMTTQTTTIPVTVTVGEPVPAIAPVAKADDSMKARVADIKSMMEEHDVDAADMADECDMPEERVKKLLSGEFDPSEKEMSALESACKSLCKADGDAILGDTPALDPADEDLGPSTYEIRDAVSAAISAKHGKGYWVDEVYPETGYAIVSYMPPYDAMSGPIERRCYRVPYEFDAAGTVQIGDAVRVERKTVYQPVEKNADGTVTYVGKRVADDVYEVPAPRGEEVALAKSLREVLGEKTDVSDARPGVVTVHLAKGAGLGKSTLRVDARIHEEDVEGVDFPLTPIGDAEDLAKAAEKGIVYLMVYQPPADPAKITEADLDTQGEWATAEDIETAAHDFMIKGAAINIMHKGKVTDDKVVENVVVQEDGWKVGRKSLRKGTWYIGVKLTKSSHEAFKKGELRGASMEGLKSFA